MIYSNTLSILNRLYKYGGQMDRPYKCILI
jgi:hypothetical protein